MASLVTNVGGQKFAIFQHAAGKFLTEEIWVLKMSVLHFCQKKFRQEFSGREKFWGEGHDTTVGK